MSKCASILFTLAAFIVESIKQQSSVCSVCLTVCLFVSSFSNINVVMINYHCLDVASIPSIPSA